MLFEKEKGKEALYKFHGKAGWLCVWAWQFVKSQQGIGIPLSDDH